MRRWIAPAAIAVIGAVGIIALWTVRASGGICIDGAEEDTGAAFGYCATYESATGALPATIAILLLVAAAYAIAARWRRAWIPEVVIGILVLVVVVTGISANLAFIDYPPDYPLQ